MKITCLLVKYCQKCYILSGKPFFLGNRFKIDSFNQNWVRKYIGWFQQRKIKSMEAHKKNEKLWWGKFMFAQVKIGVEKTCGWIVSSYILV